MLGQRPQAGRLLTPADNHVLDGHPVVVISHGYWQRSLAGASDAIGQTLAINGTPFTIVGITAPGVLRHDRGDARRRRVGTVDDAARDPLWRECQLPQRRRYEEALATASERGVAQPVRARAAEHGGHGHRRGADSSAPG